jgi:hypothetical protein
LLEGSLVMSRPSSSMVPPSIVSRPAIRRSSVDLPQPEGPTKTTNSPLLDLQVDALDDAQFAEGFSTPLSCR